MGRPKKYTGNKLEKAVNEYFMTITREKTVTELLPTGEKDSYGHEIKREVPVLNRLGAEVKVIEYLVPPTVGGLCEHLGIDRRTWEIYCDGEKHPEFIRTTTRARGLMRSWNERELLTREGSNTKGIIFNLENNYGYKERATLEVTGSLERYLRERDEEGEAQMF